MGQKSKIEAFPAVRTNTKFNSSLTAESNDFLVRICNNVVHNVVHLLNCRMHFYRQCLKMTSRKLEQLCLLLDMLMRIQSSIVCMLFLTCIFEFSPSSHISLSEQSKSHLFHEGLKVSYVRLLFSVLFYVHLTLYCLL